MEAAGTSVAANSPILVGDELGQLKGEIYIVSMWQHLSDFFSPLP